MKADKSKHAEKYRKVCTTSTQLSWGSKRKAGQPKRVNLYLLWYMIVQEVQLRFKEEGEMQNVKFRKHPPRSTKSSKSSCAGRTLVRRGLVSSAGTGGQECKLRKRD